MQNKSAHDLTQLDQLFSDPSVPQRLQQVAPTSLAAATRFWQTILTGKHLSARMKELVLIALHASVSAINSQAIARHIERATTAGASAEDVLDVLISIVGVANHALYATVPILIGELEAAGWKDAELPEASPESEAIKADFIKTRGFWNDQRDVLARLMPAYFGALSEVSMEPWKHGVLSPKERELIYIAIDSSPTHTFPPGLALHIRNALQHGATRDEILEVFQLAASMGVEGYILGAEALFRVPAAPTPASET